MHTEVKWSLVRTHTRACDIATVDQASRRSRNCVVDGYFPSLFDYKAYELIIYNWFYIVNHSAFFYFGLLSITMVPRASRCCGINLRPICFIIAYMHLISSVVDVVCHLLTVAIVTSGFQCDVNVEALQDISIPWLEPILIVVNLGTHGFYPYPRAFRNHYHIYVEQMSVVAEPRCYPGMLHIYLIDVLNFLINIIWLRIVISYVGAVHKKDPEPMRMFFSLSVVKLVMQAMYFGYQPVFYDLYSAETVWFLKLTDILIAILILVIVQKYTKFLRMEKAVKQNIEKPPSYIECLINSPVRPPAYEPKDQVTVTDEENKHKEGQDHDVEKS